MIVMGTQPRRALSHQDRVIFTVNNPIGLTPIVNRVEVDPLLVYQERVGDQFQAGIEKSAINPDFSKERNVERAQGRINGPDSDLQAVTLRRHRLRSAGDRKDGSVTPPSLAVPDKVAAALS